MYKRQDDPVDEDDEDEDDNDDGVDDAFAGEYYDESEYEYDDD